MTDPTPEEDAAAAKKRQREERLLNNLRPLVCGVLSSITVIVLVVLDAPSVAYIVVASSCGANALQQMQQIRHN